MTDFKLFTIVIFLLVQGISAHPPLEETKILLENHTNIVNSTCIHEGFYNCSKCPCNFGQDFYLYAIIGIASFSILWSLFYIISFIVVKPLRQKPGDILIVISLVTLLSATKSILEATDKLNNISLEPNHNDDQCQFIGMISLLCLNLIHFYQLSFYTYNVLTLQNPMNASKLNKTYYHSITVLLALIVTMTEFGAGCAGRNILGTCLFRTSAMLALPSSIYCTLFALTLFLGYMLQTYFTRRRRDLNRRETRYFHHYLGYLVLLCINLFAVAIIELDIGLRINKYLKNMTFQENVNTFNNLDIIKLFLINLNPFILVIAKINDPAVLKDFKRRWWQLITCQQEEDREAAIFDVEEGNRRPTNEDENDLNKGLLDMNIKDIKKQPKKKGAADKKVANQNKLQRWKDPQMFYSMFAGIHYFWYLMKKEERGEVVEGESEEYDRDDDEFGEYYRKEIKTKKKFLLHDALLKQNLPQMHREIRNKQYKIRFGIFTAYAPQLFKDMIEMDGVQLELLNSLELVRNFSNIISAGQINNKFQFMTFNSKFIIRSISKGDRRVLLKILPHYIEHLRTKPYSLLTRFYGLFRFEVMNPYTQVNWLIMRNITEKPGSSIERRYELTGGSNAKLKRTLDSDLNLSDGNITGTMGDDYFDKYEKNIYIDTDTSEAVMKAATSDVEFLKNHGLINYSLNVNLVNKTKYDGYQQRLSSSVILEVEESMEERSLGPSLLGAESSDEDHLRARNSRRHGPGMSHIQIQNPFFAIRSTRENLHYSLEIDHFFSQYDWRKKLRVFCIGISSNSSSILHPDKYGNRFVKQIKAVLEGGAYVDSVINEEADNDN